MRNSILVFALLFAGNVIADESQPQEVNYISHLCSIALEKNAGSDAFYLQQIKDMSMRGQSSSSLNKREFEQDVAEKVVDGWQSLSPAERQQLTTVADCQQTLQKRLQ